MGKTKNNIVILCLDTLAPSMGGFMNYTMSDFLNKPFMSYFLNYTSAIYEWSFWTTLVVSMSDFLNYAVNDGRLPCNDKLVPSMRSFLNYTSTIYESLSQLH